MKKPLQPHLLKRVPTACKGERTMKWRGRPPIGGQDSDRVSHRCFAPYTLLPLRGISPQGETRNLRRKTESHILHVPLRHSPFGGWRHHLARWEACHWIRGSRGSPMNPVPLPPPQAGALWVLSHGAMSLQESVETYSAPCIGVAREHDS